MALLGQQITPDSYYPLSGNGDEKIGRGYSKAISELYYFDLRYAKTILQEVSDEANEVSREDLELEPISTQAHNEAVTLLTAIH